MTVQHNRKLTQSGNKSIPVHRVAVLRPFELFLKSDGAPVERGFQQAGLPYCALENADNYIPSHGFYAFLDHALFHYASRMLRDSDMKVTDIAFQLGYTDPSHFTRAFRRITGVTPSAYRQQHDLRA